MKNAKREAYVTIEVLEDSAFRVHTRLGRRLIDSRSFVHDLTTFWSGKSYEQQFGDLKRLFSRLGVSGDVRNSVDGFFAAFISEASRRACAAYRENEKAVLYPRPVPLGWELGDFDRRDSFPDRSLTRSKGV